MNKICVICALALLFTSCTATISVHVQDDGNVGVSYNSNVVGELLSSIFGEKEFRDSFRKDEIEKALKLSNFEKVEVTRADSDEINFNVEIKEGDEDIILKSGILEAKGEKSELSFTREKLLSLYELMPDEARYYVDLFMAPVFTAQKMSDAEYMELVEVVYGKNVAQKLSEAKLSFELHHGSKFEKKSIPLLKLLNLSGKFELCIKSK